jgi:surface protein
VAKIQPNSRNGLLHGSTPVAVSSQSFNEPITNWNTSSVTSMKETFNTATSFNQPLLWDVSNVKEFFGTFIASGFNADISGWDLQSAETTQFMFAITPFNQDISAWTVGKNVNFVGMFYNATSFNVSLKQSSAVHKMCALACDDAAAKEFGIACASPIFFAISTNSKTCPDGMSAMGARWMLCSLMRASLNKI